MVNDLNPYTNDKVNLQKETEGECSKSFFDGFRDYAHFMKVVRNHFFHLINVKKKQSSNMHGIENHASIVLVTPAVDESLKPLAAKSKNVHPTQMAKAVRS